MLQCDEHYFLVLSSTNQLNQPIINRHLLTTTFCTVPVALFFKKYKPADKFVIFISPLPLMIFVYKIFPDWLVRVRVPVPLVCTYSIFFEGLGYTIKSLLPLFRSWFCKLARKLFAIVAGSLYFTCTSQ